MRDELYQAVLSGTLEEVMQLIEQDNYDINEFHPGRKKRLIDVAARNGDLDKIKYLYSKGAKLQIEQPQATPGFLYWVCACSRDYDKDKADEILTWLLENDHYKKLGDGIDIKHIDAASGLSYENAQTLHAGLLPSHYAALVDNPNIQAEELNQIVPDGYFKGVTPAWILANSTYGNLLEKFQESNVVIDLDSTPYVPDDDKKHPFKESASASTAILLAVQEKWDLLESFAEKAEKLDLNKTIEISNSLALILANKNKFDLLKKLSRKSDLIDLSKFFTDHNEHQKTLLSRLAEAKEWDLLRENLTNLLAEDEGFEKFQALLDMHSNHQKEYEFMLVVFMEYIYPHTKDMQILSDSNKDLLKTFFEMSESIPPTSPFYKEAQAAKADVLLELKAKPPEVAAWLVTEPLKVTIDNLPLWNRAKDPKNTLLILAIDAYQKSENNERVFSLMSETVSNLEKTAEENQKLKNQIENLKNSSDNKPSSSTPAVKGPGFF